MPDENPDDGLTPAERENLQRLFARWHAGEQLNEEELGLIRRSVEAQLDRLRQEARRRRHPDAESVPVRPPRIDRENTLTVQLALAEFWGTDEEFARRERFIEAVNGLLEPEGYGKFTGSEVGGGKTNLFWSNIWDADWGRTVELVLGELGRSGWLDRAVLARSYFTSSKVPPDLEYPDVEEVVVWPEGFQGKFSLL